mmetsp:Transcript_17315/g.41975  ORF Transcript_17315/g.41975 Transcript_17315/m.41975 type:complete len:248 (-) Transcript_17315:113-856(-)
MLELSTGWEWNEEIRHGSRRPLLDVLALLMLAYVHTPVSSLFMLHEDDAVACPGAIDAIRHGVQAAHGHFKFCTSHTTVGKLENGLKSWRGMRFTYGIAGLGVPAAAIESLAMHLLHSAERLPEDLSVLEWRLGAGTAPWQHDLCPFFANRCNLFERGAGQDAAAPSPADSDAAPDNQPSWPQCHADMDQRDVFRAAGWWNASECGASDVDPCAAKIFRRRNEAAAQGYERVSLEEMAGVDSDRIFW